MKVLEIAVGAIFAPTRFSLVRISVRDLVADRKSLVRNSGVGGGGQNRIFTSIPSFCNTKCHFLEDIHFAKLHHENGSENSGYVKFSAKDLQE